MGFLLFNGKLVTGEGVTEAAIFIDGEKIAKIVKADRLEKDFLSKYSSFQAIDLQGKFVFAGGIDAHVHFREPGMTSKADIGLSQEKVSCPAMIAAIEATTGCRFM